MIIFMCAAFLRDLIERGLLDEYGCLCVIDRAKGFCKAIHSVFEPQALVQRCQWHKRENIVRYLPKVRHATCCCLQQAYGYPTYPSARVALLNLRQELRLFNLSEVASLDKGFEETWIFHRLGEFCALVLSFKPTNCLELLNSHLERPTKKIGAWRTANQSHWWVSSALLAAEPRLQRLKGYCYLPQLQAGIQQ